MSEVTDASQERLQLLLADGQLSLAALQRSLTVGGHTSGEASLHVMDLSSLVASFGLRAQAQRLKDLAQGLAEDPVAAASQVQSVLPQLQSLIQAMQSGQPDLLQTVSQALLGSLSAVPQQPESPSMAPSASPVLASPPATDEVQLPQDPVGRWSESTPYFSAGLATAPYAAEKAPISHTPVVQAPYQPSWTELRTQVLQIVQDAGLTMPLQAGDALSSSVHKLNAVQDALVRVGQLPVRNVLPDIDCVDEVWADPSVLELLEHLQVFSQRASRVSAQVRNLTVFVLWQGATLSHAELEHIGQRMSDAGGRVDMSDAGVQLVLPVSTQRMRMVSYQVDGQWHAVNQAHFMGWAQSGASCQLKLRCGLCDMVLPVQEPGPVANMNLYPWPAQVPAPASLVAVALDGAGRVHLVHRHPA